VTRHSLMKSNNPVNPPTTAVQARERIIATSHLAQQIQALLFEAMQAHAGGALDHLELRDLPDAIKVDLWTSAHSTLSAACVYEWRFCQAPGCRRLLAAPRERISGTCDTCIEQWRVRS
jgi:hypothetical protein